MQDAIGRRLADIGLLMLPDKTRIVYCEDYKCHQEFEQVSFTFCGYMFRPREAFDKAQKKSYTGFMPAAAPGKLTDMSRRAARPGGCTDAPIRHWTTSQRWQTPLYRAG
jgi:RNA-directed DNA polymerase